LGSAVPAITDRRQVFVDPDLRVRNGEFVQVAPRDPIFIHGILPRSGTNFLWDLLLLHPHCGPPREPVREDLFLDHSDHLIRFADEVRAAWDPRWGHFEEDVGSQLYNGLGRGLVSFLHVDPGRRLVTKSPSVKNLERFFDFFPAARLVILVRDGRSVVQSSMTTFGWDLDRGGREWAAAADEIVAFQAANVDRSTQWCLVRYEDLVDDPEVQMTHILEFLGLDAGVYDFSAARDLPVRGSSSFGVADHGVHWEPVRKDATFSPKHRWQSWNPASLERFNWLAGQQLQYFGYSPVGAMPAGTGILRHRIRDWRWNGRRAMRLGTHRLRSRLGPPIRPLRRRLRLVRDA
jgi:protein-tyrosine sulfotransferase